MSIQGRSLPFNSSDIVPLGVKLRTAGTYTIGIGTLDGFFQNTSKRIYLEDLVTGTISNLRTAPYTFTSDAGVFNSRFRIRYQYTFSSDDDKVSTSNAQEVLVYCPSNDLQIESSKEKIATVKLFDVTGREVYQKDGIHEKECSISITNLPQIMIVKITLENGEVVTKKVATTSTN